MSSQDGSRVHPFGGANLRRIAFAGGAVLPLISCAVFFERSKFEGLSAQGRWIWGTPLVLLVGGAWSLSYWLFDGPWKPRVEACFGVLWTVLAMLAALLVWPWWFFVGGVVSGLDAGNGNGRAPVPFVLLVLLVLLACPMPACAIYARAAWFALVKSDRTQRRRTSSPSWSVRFRVLVCIAALWMYLHSGLLFVLTDLGRGAWLLGALIELLQIVATASLLVATFYRSPEPQRDRLVHRGLQLGVCLAIVQAIEALSSSVWMFLLRGDRPDNSSFAGSSAIGILFLVVGISLPILSVWVFGSVLASRRAKDSGPAPQALGPVRLEA